MEPGGDADFLVGTTNGPWSAVTGAPAVATDFVHGWHSHSIKYPINTACQVTSKGGVIADAGGTPSVWFYMNALPNAVCNIGAIVTSGGVSGATLRVTPAGVIQLWRGNISQSGADGPTLSTGQWYLIQFAFTITSATVNSYRVFVFNADGVTSAGTITVNNVASSTTGIDRLKWGINVADTTFDIRTSDHYADKDSSLTSPGNVWVTAKRAFSNGTLNQLTTQVGAGGSSYGTGHAPQVNERPLSLTNAWSKLTAAAALTEEFNLELLAQGDFDLTGSTILGVLGWVSAKSAASQTGQIVVDGQTNNISLTSTNTVFQFMSANQTYPAGTGTDIGIITDAVSSTTVTLNECGCMIAFIPAPPALDDGAWTPPPAWPDQSVVSVWQ